MTQVKPTRVDDVKIKLSPEMVKYLLAGKVVMIEQPNGSHWHFKTETMTKDDIEALVHEAFQWRDGLR